MKPTQTNIKAFEKRIDRYYSLFGFLSVVIFIYLVYRSIDIYDYISPFIDRVITIKSILVETMKETYKILGTAIIIFMPLFLQGFALSKAYKKLDGMKRVLKDKKKKSNLYTSKG